MSLYLDYEKCKKKYNEIVFTYESVIEEKECLFIKTQPKSTTIDKVLVSQSKNNNLFDNYLIDVEKKQLDLKIEEAKKLVDERFNYLKTKEKELRRSKEWIDKIYVYRFIEQLPVKAILHLIPYEEAQIYRVINEIKRNIENIVDE